MRYQRGWNLKPVGFSSSNENIHCPTGCEMFVQTRGSGLGLISATSRGSAGNLPCAHCKLVALAQNHFINPTHQVPVRAQIHTLSPSCGILIVQEVPESSISEVLRAQGWGLDVVGTGTQWPVCAQDTGQHWTRQGHSGTCPPWVSSAGGIPRTEPGIAGTIITSCSQPATAFQVEMLRKPRR